MKTDKINKKAKEYKLTRVCNAKNYAFVIDGSMAFNKQNFLNYLYILNLETALKKYLIENDPAKAVLKAEKYLDQKFKKYYQNDFPLVSLGIYKKEEDNLQILILNNIKCYLERKNIKAIENKDIDISKTITKTSYKQLFNQLNDVNSYICYETSYDDALSILFCNEGMQNYQKYLKLKNNEFFKLIKQQGMKNCYYHLKRIEEKDKERKEIPRYKQKDDVAAIYKMLI